jgi:hypothetical protein
LMVAALERAALFGIIDLLKALHAATERGSIGCALIGCILLDQRTPMHAKARLGR